MAEQWISAAEAYSIVQNNHAICERLHAGLIIARAKRFILGGRQDDDFVIPSGFWWAEGHVALEQNWKSGDFSTVIRDQYSAKAFGVSIELSGILEMLPAERRAAVTRNLSVAFNGRWTRAIDAANLVRERTGLSLIQAIGELTLQAGLGVVASRAILAELEGDAGDGMRLEWQKQEWDIPDSFWLELWQTDGTKVDFEAGSFCIPACQTMGGKQLTLTKVYFLKECIEAIWPQPQKPVAPVKNSPGGRPPAAFSDELICAIWAQIYDGDLNPKKQSDIESAMLDWASKHGHALGESTAREKAQKIWRHVKPEAKNPSK